MENVTDNMFQDVQINVTNKLDKLMCPTYHSSTSRYLQTGSRKYVGWPLFLFS